MPSNLSRARGPGAEGLAQALCLRNKPQSHFRRWSTGPRKEGLTGALG